MDLFIYILKSSGLLALFYVVYIGVLRKETFFNTNRYYLLFGIIASLSLPFLTFTNTIYKDIPNAYSYNIINASSVNTPITEVSNTIDTWTIILSIYALGILFMAFRFMKQLLSLYSLIKKHPITLQSEYYYIKVSEDVSPFSFFKYIVYNPNKHSEKELKMILKHEQSHASQLHSFDIMISNLLLIVLWMNPIAWLYKKSIEENLEFMADNDAIQQINSKKEYQLSMLKEVSNYQLQPVLANNFYQSLIKKRIIMLHKNQSSTKKQWRLLLILPLLGFFLWSFNVEDVIKYHDNNILEPKVDYIEASLPIMQESSNNNHSINETNFKLNNEDNTITVTIDKNTTDSELENLKELFKNNYNTTLKFSGIKRNGAGEITKIKISMKSKNSNADYNQEDSNGIPEISISYNKKDNTISIGKFNHQNHSAHFVSAEGNAFVYEINEDEHGNVQKWVSKDGKKVSKGTHEYIIHEEDGDKRVIHIESDSNTEGHSKVWISKNGEEVTEDVKVIIESDGDKENSIFYINTDEDDDEDSIFVKKSDDDGFFFINSDDENPLIYINDKKASKEDVEKLDTDAIKNIEIIKGDKAINKYGKEAKDGVILINTK